MSSAEPRGAVTVDADREAVLAVRAGDRDAFGRLVSSYQQRLYGLCLTMVRDPAAAEEVAQDAFVRAYTHLDRYDEGRPIYPWLATIATRLAQSWLRRRGRLLEREGAVIDADHAGGGAADPLARAIANDRSRRLWERVAALPSGERTAVYLYYRQGMKVADVARTLGVTRGTVKTQLFRARQHLRDAMDDRGSSDKPEEAL